jgi:very-short-patch-repair endonuclease
VRRLAGFEREVVELIVPRARTRPVAGARLHRMVLAPSDIVVVDHIPVTTVERTLLDIAGRADEDTVEVALDDALHRKITSIARLRRQLDQARQGLRGARLLRELVDARDDGMPPPASPAETLFWRLVARAGIKGGVRQYKVVLGGRTYYIDVAFPDAMVAVEIDSWRWHGNKIRWRKDLARRNALTAAGWRVLHFTKEDILNDPERVAKEIYEAVTM